MNSQFQDVAPNAKPSPANGTTTKVSEGLSGHSRQRPYQHIRSCIFCRAPKTPRRLCDKRILDRLADLEALVRRLDTTEANGQIARGSPRETPAHSATEPEDQSSQIQQQFGRLVIDNTRSCYVSNILWASLGDEVRFHV